MIRDLAMTVHVVLDSEPDERGQLMAAAVTTGDRMVALTINTN